MAGHTASQLGEHASLLQFLASCGYELAAVELRACGHTPQPTTGSGDDTAQQALSAA